MALTKDSRGGVGMFVSKSCPASEEAVDVAERSAGP